MKRVLREGLVVALAGAVFAFAANALSPRGLSLKRDYFQTGNGTSGAPYTSSNSIAVNPAPNQATDLKLLAARLQAKGLSLADSNRVLELFQDPGRGSGLVIFVDARDDDHYQKAHILGAYQLDYYRPDKYLAELLPACQGAREIVVYCNGGNCEDSELAGTLLRQALPDKTVLVYAGGFAEWHSRGLPLESGGRNSGVSPPTTK